MREGLTIATGARQVDAGRQRLMAGVAKVLVAAGVLLAAIGLAALYAPWLVSWFGRLPGDINVTRDGTRIFIPITSMIIVSVVLTIVINILLRR